MSPQDALQFIQAKLALQDIYVCEAAAYADREYDPTALAIKNLQLQLRLSPQPTAESFECGPPKRRQRCLRYLVDTGLRILKPDVQTVEEPINREQLLAEISATFIVKYAFIRPDTDVTEDEVVAFHENVVYHVWPYWREFLQATAARLRLPAIVLPMKAPKTRARRKP